MWELNLLILIVLYPIIKDVVVDRSGWYCSIVSQQVKMSGIMASFIALTS